MFGGMPPAYHNEDSTHGYFDINSPEMSLSYDTAYGPSGSEYGFTGLLAPGGHGRAVTGIKTGGSKHKKRTVTTRVVAKANKGSSSRVTKPTKSLQKSSHGRRTRNSKKKQTTKKTSSKKKSKRYSK